MFTALNPPKIVEYYFYLHWSLYQSTLNWLWTEIRTLSSSIVRPTKVHGKRPRWSFADQKIAIWTCFRLYPNFNLSYNMIGILNGVEITMYIYVWLISHFGILEPQYSHTESHTELQITNKETSSRKRRIAFFTGMLGTND